MVSKNQPSKCQSLLHLSILLLTPTQRGLVPAIKFSNGVLNDEIITESAVVSHFLADAFPSHLLPASHESPTAPLIRARISFFVDTWFSKVNHKMFEGFRCVTDKQREEKAGELVEAIKNEVEPLLKGCGPFFGGSKKMTLAEVSRATVLQYPYGT